MQVAPARIDQVRQVGLDEHVDGNTLSRLAIQWQVQLLDYPTLGAVGTEEILCSDFVLVAGEVVSYSGCDDFGFVIFNEFQQGCVEADLETIVNGMSDENRLEKCLWKIGWLAGTGLLVITLDSNQYVAANKRGSICQSHLSLGIMSPRMNTRVLFSSHAVAPSCMLHAVSIGSYLLDISVKANVSQTLWESKVLVL